LSSSIPANGDKIIISGTIFDTTSDEIYNVSYAERIDSNTINVHTMRIDDPTLSAPTTTFGCNDGNSTNVGDRAIIAW
jgi:hypothetical protein